MKTIKNKFIAVKGVIGVSKTTLAELLAEKINTNNKNFLKTPKQFDKLYTELKKLFFKKAL